MNFSTIIGVIAGLCVVGFVIWLTALDSLAYLNVPGLIIVIGGTLAATLVSYPAREFLRMFKLMGIVLYDNQLDAKRQVDEIEQLARKWFRDDLRGVERDLDSIENTFLKTGVQLVIDKTPLQDIIDLLHWRITRLRAQEQAEAQMFVSMAGFAPAFGMLGTLIGLINMLTIMDNKNFSEIGFHLAIALVTTFYGLLFSNLLFKPIATKLERRTERRVMLMTMVMEGISLMSQRRTPSFIRATLESFIAQHEDELHDPVNLEELSEPSLRSQRLVRNAERELQTKIEPQDG
ncbi:motility protein A [Pleionea mediterranea]|uniref:Chemotaxis protein MotA n=1 Tax=Pleionea mediterranea TaxID=523701 RepID=A0A316GEE8_9GAMM|nr:MotA/TolQ/ExbB proton channel family protein [Pleionea mediterranea]PWK53037.1 chemotaxis protein MotA [Pleionea mediterranea]